MKKILIAGAGVLAATPALAHHPLDGMPMQTFAHGLLSGVGHPVLGFDHLFFIIAVGIAALFTGRAMTAPAGYIAGMLGGCALVIGGVALPAVEFVIALSLVVAGAILMSGRALSLIPAMGLFAVLGLFHGWAFGGSIAGQEGGAPIAVTVGYLIGLAATQWVIAILAGKLVARLMDRIDASALPARLAGGMVAGAGAFLVLEAAEGTAFAALGWG